MTSLARRARQRAPLLVAGIYVWLVGVLPARDGGTIAMLLVVLAPLLLVSGLLTPRLWALRWLSLYGFALCSLTALLVANESSRPGTSSLFVALGWAAYTIVWGLVGGSPVSEPESLGSERPSGESRSGKLLPRHSSSRWLFVVPLLGTIAGLYLFRAAFGLERLETRILATILLLAGSLLLVRLSGELGAFLHRTGAPSRSAAPAWGLWLLLLGLGVLGWYLRTRAG